MELFCDLYSRYSQANSYKSILLSVSQQNCLNKQTQKSGSLKPIVKKINTLLSGTKTRFEGLQLLQAFLPTCPSEVLQENAEKWFRFSAQVLPLPKPGWQEKATACRVLTQLLRKTRVFPEVLRQIPPKAVQVLVTSLVTATAQWATPAHDVIFECFMLFPGQCSNQKGTVEKFLVKSLDWSLGPTGSSTKKVCSAGRALSSLPGTGGAASEQGRASTRGEQVQQLLSVAHTQADVLFDGIIEKEEFDHPREYRISLPDLHQTEEDGAANDPVQLRLNSLTRLVNSCSWITQLLSGSHARRVSISPPSVLGLPIRLLQVHGSVLNRYKSQEHRTLALILPLIHQAALRLLRHLLQSLGESLDAYWDIILQLIAGILSSQQAREDVTKTLAYDTLSTLVRVSRGRHSISVMLMKALVEDATPTQDAVTLQNAGAGLASLKLQKKKSKKKGYSVTSETSVNSSMEVNEAQKGSKTRLTMAALQLARDILEWSLHSLDRYALQVLQQGVLEIARQQESGITSQSVYKDSETRVCLMATLVALASFPHPAAPPPYTAIMTCLSAAQADPQPQVSTEATRGLNALSLLVANPQLATYLQAVEEEKRKEEEAAAGAENGSKNHNGHASDDSEEEENEDDEQMDAEVGTAHESQSSPQVQQCSSTFDSNIEEEEEHDEVAEKQNEELSYEEELTLNLTEECSSGGDNDDDDEEIEVVTSPSKEVKVTKQDKLSPIGSVKRSAQFAAVAEDSVSSSNISNVKKKKKIDDLSVEEMMASFVDAPPDE